MNYLDKLKIAINSSSIEISFSELKDPVDFLDRRKKCGISTQEAWHKQEEFNKSLKELKINLKNKKNHWLILTEILRKETITLNLQMTPIQ